MTFDEEHNVMAKLTDQVALNYKWRRRTWFWASAFGVSILLFIVPVVSWLTYEPAPPWSPPAKYVCQEATFDLSLGGVTCGPDQTVEMVPPAPDDDDWTVICRCPKGEPK